MSFRPGALAFLVLGLAFGGSTLTQAADPKLRLPDFDHLQSIATESVNVTIGRWPLSLVARAMEARNPEDVEVASLLKGLKAIYVRSYEFAEDNMYSEADVDAVRQQLTAPGWTALAQVRHRKGEDDNVDVFVSMEGDRINGLAIIASAPRKFTIVNVVGSIDTANLAKVEDKLGLPSFAL